MDKIPTITINQDVKCRQCGKGGACKTVDGDYGLCLECANKNIGRLKMNKTLEQINSELETILQNYWPNITSAFEKSGYELTISSRIVLEKIGEEIAITPTIEFYPEPKTKSEKYTVRVNENQLTLFDKKQGAA